MPIHGAVTASDHAIQRRTVTTLVGSQMLGGVGVSSGIAVGSLLAEEILGSPDLAGLGGTFQVLGSALIAIPMARIMAARGRRPGLGFGYLLGIAGALLLTASGVLGSFTLLLAGSILFGGATAANNQARYAAADLAEERHRGRDLSVVVWATTIGAVLGPNLVGVAGSMARSLGVPALTGPFLFSLAGFVLAGTLLTLRLRPDPLLYARQRAQAQAEEPLQHHGSVVRGLRVALRTPPALLGLITVALGHAVMVSVMVMTPLHMHHGGAELRVIGLVISIHVLGMFAFSPLVGFAVDRFGARPIALVGSAVLVTAALLAAQAPTGWSCRAHGGALPAGPGLVVHPRQRLDPHRRGGAGRRAGRGPGRLRPRDGSRRRRRRRPGRGHRGAARLRRARTRRRRRRRRHRGHGARPPRARVRLGLRRL